jgi:uncharacterized protein YbjT (DUF2867 family)
MNVLLIGATGGTGKELLPRLLEAGHTVTALVRRPEAVTVKHERLTILPGEVRDASAVDKAVQGKDAVVCAFGPRSFKKDDIQEVLMRNVVAAMETRGVKRLVNLSAWGSDPAVRPHGLMQLFIQKGLLRHVFADKRRGEALLFASNIGYVNVCPGMLLNMAARGGVKASADGKGIKPFLTRADLALWMMAQLTDDTWLRRNPIIGY